MSDEIDGCLPALNALRRFGELREDMLALGRRFDREEDLRVRLGERVSDLTARIDRHETVQNEAMQQLTEIISDLKGTMRKIEEIVKAAIVSPPVPNGSTLVQSWRETSPKSKAKITGAVVGVLMAPDILKALGSILLKITDYLLTR